jgi:flagellar M-ring protein FliF
MNGNLLSRPKSTSPVDGTEPSGAALEYRHQVEADLIAKISATLGPLLGSEKFRAGVSVECDFTGGELSEEIFDPAHSVMLTSQRTEDNVGAMTASGIPGTASTLPRPTSRTGGGSNKTTRTTENISYQSSRSVKKTHLPAGVMRKMSLSVLVDQDVTWEKEKNAYKRVLVQPSPEKLKVIRDLVAGITGFSAERGDQLVIETLPFETTLLLEPPALPDALVPGKPGTPTIGLPLSLMLDKKTLMIVGGAVAGLLVFGLAAFLAGRKRRKNRAQAEASAPAALPSASGSHPAAQALPAPGQLENQIESQLAERDALQAQMDAQALSSLKLAPVITKKAEVFAKHLREKIAKEPDISVQILRTWIREDEN